jgi:hypothetical protein
MFTISITSSHWAPIPASQIDPAIIASLASETDSQGTPLTHYIPQWVPLLERPWLNLFTPEGMFRPFNITRWIQDSVFTAVAENLHKERAEREHQALVRQQMEASDSSTLKQLERMTDAIWKSWSTWAEVIHVPKYFFTLVRTWTAMPRATPTPTPPAIITPTTSATPTPTITSLFWRIPHSIDLSKYGIHLTVELGFPKDSS